MEKTGQIEIRIEGTKGNVKLSLDTYDIREVVDVLKNVEQMLFSNGKEKRPLISYRIEEGSVKHLFKTTLQYVIGFNAILGQVNQSQSISFLDPPTARAFKEFQEIVRKKDYSFSITTSVDKSNELVIDRSTSFYVTEEVWTDAEFYFYGCITNLGGKDKANIHLETDRESTLRIQTSKEDIEKIESNPLYKDFGIRAIGEQHSETGEIDKNSLVFKDIINYRPAYDEAYLKGLRQKAETWLSVIDPDDWLRELRGYDD